MPAHRSIREPLLIIVTYLSMYLTLHIIMSTDAYFTFTSASGSWYKHSRHNLSKQLAKKFYYTRKILYITRTFIGRYI